MSISPSAAVPAATGHSHDLTVDDFMTGLIAAFAKRDVAAISIRSPEFYKAIADLYRTLVSVAKENDLDLRFVVSLDPLYEDSPIVRDAISAAVQRDLVSLDNPEYQDMRLKVRPDEARLFLERLPGSVELYAHLVDEFLKIYPWYVRRRA